MKKVLYLFIILAGMWFPRTVHAQIPFNPQDSTYISLLTCAPGTELYSRFGHSAIRIYQPGSGLDIVFNYGLFDFQTPHFYLKFIRGKLLYQLGAQRFPDFLNFYQQEGRQVTEMPFQLSAADKRKIMYFLEKNYQPENRKYLYDFFYDNCASRIRDVLEKSTAMKYARERMENTPAKSYRQLLDNYLVQAPWEDFGIDLILGLPTDREAGFRGEMFLPDFLERNLQAGLVKQQAIGGNPVVLVEGTNLPSVKKPFLTPLPVFVVFFFLVLLLSWKSDPRVLKWLDSILFSAAGLAGLLFMFMWFGTEHKATYQNMNLLWANPLAILLPFAGYLSVGTSRRVTQLVLLSCLVAVLGFWWLPQQLHPAILPIALAIAVRSATRLGYLKNYLK